MAFNFGNLLMNIGRALPGFVNGERAAIQDNWTDLQKYNEVKQGQMSNLFRAAAWPYALSNVRNQAVSNELATTRDFGDTAVWWHGQQGRVNEAKAGSLFSSVFWPAYWGNMLGTLNKMTKKNGGMTPEQLQQLQALGKAQGGVGPDGSPIESALDYGNIFGRYNLGGSGGFGGFGGFDGLPSLVHGETTGLYY